MIHLIGGAPRSGKSTLTRKLRAEHGASFFSLDHLMRGLLRGVPDVDFGTEILTHGIQQSRNIQTQCQNEDVAFFDTSANFSKALENAQSYLLTN